MATAIPGTDRTDRGGDRKTRMGMRTDGGDAPSGFFVSFVHFVVPPAFVVRCRVHGN
jgi:hypothetical protein